MRNLLFFTAGLAVAAAILLFVRFAMGVDAGGRLVGFGLVAGISSVISAWALIRYARAFTECTPAGLRTRGLRQERLCPWDQVDQIAIRAFNSSRGPTTYTVVVTTTGGDRLRLGAPVDGGVMRDPEFETKVREIRRYWQRATEVHPDSDAAPVPVESASALSPWVPVRVVLRGVAAVFLVAAVVALPFTVRVGVPALQARLGQGQPGHYIANTDVCGATCFWVGDFTASGASGHRGEVTIAPGANILRVGERVPAVDVDGASMVYPAGGGTAWIPTASLLSIITICLSLEVRWFIRRRARLRSEPGREPLLAQHPDGIGRLGGARAMSAVGLGLTIAGVMGILIVGGSVLFVAGQAEPPSRPSPTALACADYDAWLLAQSDNGLPIEDPPALARAVHEAPAGQLSEDLVILSSDVQQAISQSGSVLGAPAELDWTDALSAVSKDCR